MYTVYDIYIYRYIYLDMCTDMQMHMIYIDIKFNIMCLWAVSIQKLQLPARYRFSRCFKKLGA